MATSTDLYDAVAASIAKGDPAMPGGTDAELKARATAKSADALRTHLLDTFSKTHVLNVYSEGTKLVVKIDPKRR